MTVLFHHKMHIETAQQDDTINEIKEHFVPMRKKKTISFYSAYKKTDTATREITLTRK